MFFLRADLAVGWLTSDRVRIAAGVVVLLGTVWASDATAAGTSQSGEDFEYPSLYSQSATTATEAYPTSFAPSGDAARDEQSADEWSASSCDCQCACGCSPDGGFLACCPLIQPSDHCYDDFISPMTNPVYFEDPRNLTEARVIFLNHKVPLAAGGGDVQLYALQVRAALTDRLSLIATKDGYIVSSNPLIDDGWADISAGVKYLIYSDPCAQQLASVGVVYELPVGTPDALQGNGDGTFDIFLTGGSQLGCNGHWIGAGGFVLPTDDQAESTWCYISNHIDYEFHSRYYALMEFNWYHWLESGGGGIGGVEGGDLFNLGSTGVAGNNIVTGAFGLKYKPSCHTELGIAWELPLTERRDVLENRITFDWILRY
jgi:hypothetical protein